MVTIDVTRLPYNGPFIEFLRNEKARGRRLVLATAAHKEIAESVAAHLGIFDEVLASDGSRNLKGKAKALALVDRFGEDGFVYAGNSTSDMPVWQAAKAALLVNVSRSLAARVQQFVQIEREFCKEESTLSGLIRELRPHQWTKNILVFVPVLTGAHNLIEPMAWWSAVLALISFSAVASAIYIINDILDINADRAHPSKRHRPLASGALTIPVGLVASAGLLVVGSLIGIGQGILPVLSLYVFISISYSAWLKERPLVDVFALSLLYILRLVAGGIATGYHVSLWLLGFAGFFFLGLALLKRVEELTSVGQRRDAPAARRGYDPEDREILQLFGCCASFVSALVLALYVDSSTAAANYSKPGLIWAVVPLMLFWQCRLWLSTSRGRMHDDPILYAARDWVSWLVGGALACVVIAARVL